MELSIIWVKDLFALYFKCCYWNMKMQMRKMCLLKSFSSLLEASGRKSSFDYLIGCGKVCCNHNTSSRKPCNNWRGWNFQLFEKFWKKKKNPRSFVSNVIFTWAMIQCCGQSHLDPEAYDVVSIFKSKRHCLTQRKRERNSTPMFNHPRPLNQTNLLIFRTK